MHSQISHVNPYINSKVRSSVHASSGASRAASGVHKSGEKHSERLDGSSMHILTHSPAAKQGVPAAGTPGRVPDSIFALSGGSLSGQRAKGLTQSKTASVLPEALVSPAYKNLPRADGFSALHVRHDAPVNSYTQALSKRSNTSIS